MMKNNATRLVPATATNLKPWIREALESGPLERGELLQAIDPTAKINGFFIADVSALKKALIDLNKNGEVYNLRKGWWALRNALEVNQGYIASSHIIPADLSMGKRSIRVLREIGRGNQHLYVLQFEEEVQSAKTQGQDFWNCKIGISKNATQRLLGGGSNTYGGRLPQVGLLINCNDAAALEKVIHSSLRILDYWDKSAAGTEWFRTSPHHLENFYIAWLKACAVLKINE